MEQIYIEDYVVSFLKQKKTDADKVPVRLALYGFIEKKEEDRQYIIYGAVCEEKGRSIEETGRNFFTGYDLLGYVNVYNNGTESISNYNVFFDENEAMQEYLIFDHKKKETSGYADRKKKKRKQTRAGS